MQYREYASERARITEGAKVCFYKVLIKLFSFVNRSYLLLMCGWGWRGPDFFVAAAAGSARVCGGELVNSGFLKKERKKVVSKQPLPV